MASLFIAGTAPAIAALVDEAAGEGPVAVLGRTRLARKLGERLPVIAIAGERARLRRAPRAVCAAAEALPLAAASVAAVVIPDVGKHDGWEAVLAEALRVTAADGVVVLVDRVPAIEVSRRALCGGIVDIRQRSAGRHLLTWGRPSALQHAP